VNDKEKKLDFSRTLLPAAVLITAVLLAGSIFPQSASSKAGKCRAPMPKLRNECVNATKESDAHGIPVLKLTNICSEVLRVKVCDGPDGNYDNHGCDASTINPSKIARFGLRERGTFTYWVGSYEERSGVDNIDPATGGPGDTPCSGK